MLEMWKIRRALRAMCSSTVPWQTARHQRNKRLWGCQPVKLSHFITEFKGEEVNQVTLKVDNKFVIDLNKNLVYHSFSKHIDTWYHFIYSYLEQMLFELEYVKIKEQLANDFSKALWHLNLLKCV